MPDEPSDRQPVYEPSGPVVDGIELTTGRLSCCGAGVDRCDDRTGERLHFAFCASNEPINDVERAAASTGLTSCRDVLRGAS